MANYTWRTLQEKLIAIGFLAIPNVIQAISAQVPANLEERFRTEFEGLYSEPYPYVTKAGSKYIWQFRIQLNDTDGCPEAIKELLDDRYGTRINNNSFITELVTKYGFSFQNGEQNVERIRHCVAGVHGQRYLKYFDQGYYIYQDFIEDIKDIVIRSRSLPIPTILSYEPSKIVRRARRNRNTPEGTALSQNQISNLGWIGEAYIAYLLEISDSEFLKAIDIPPRMNYTFIWFNRGFDEADSGSWDDKSVGRGCDIEVTLADGTTIFIEAIKAMGVMEIPSDLPYELEDPSKFKMNMNILRKLRYYLKLSIGQVANRFHSKIIHGNVLSL